MQAILVDIERYQAILEHALSKVDFSIDTGICMLPGNLNLNIGKNCMIPIRFLYSP